MGYFAANAADDHTGVTETRRDREKASEMIGLMKSMIAVASYWTIEYAGSTNGCWNVVIEQCNEWMLKKDSAGVAGVCNERKRGEVNCGKDPGTMVLPFCASWTRSEGATFLM